MTGAEIIARIKSEGIDIEDLTGGTKRYEWLGQVEHIVSDHTDATKDEYASRLEVFKLEAHGGIYLKWDGVKDETTDENDPYSWNWWDGPVECKPHKQTVVITHWY